MKKEPFFKLNFSMKEMEEKFIIKGKFKQFIHLKEIDKQNSNQLKAKINDLSIDVTNETLGEVLSLAPYFTSSFENLRIYKGNIIADLQKTHFDLYDHYKELKIKWKIIELIKNDDNDEKYLNETVEMAFLKSKIESIEEEIKYFINCLL